jgi:excisionase family DNA binding protein
MSTTVSGGLWQCCLLPTAIGVRAAWSDSAWLCRTVGGKVWHRIMLTVTEAAQRVGRSPGTVRRWVREGRLAATTSHGRRLIDPGALDEVRDEMYPMLPLPPEWQILEDGSPAPLSGMQPRARRDSNTRPSAPEASTETHREGPESRMNTRGSGPFVVREPWRYSAGFGPISGVLANGWPLSLLERSRDRPPR